jgi:glycosyltransferase involved in cell wall biosynthesis
MNILFISDMFPANGGIEMVTRTLASALAVCGHSVAVCYRKKSKDTFVNSSVSQYQFPKTNETETINVYSQENIDFLRKLLIEKNIQVLISQHAFNIFYNKLCKKAKSGLNVKFIQCHHFHLLWLVYTRSKKYNTKYIPAFLLKAWRFFETLYTVNKAIKNSDKLVLLSKHYVEQCKKMFPWKNLNSVIAIYPLQNLNAQQVNFQQKEKMIFYIGRMAESQKRMSMIVKFWSMVCLKYKDWKLVFVGDGPDLESTKKLAENLPNVCFEGYKEDSVPYFARASIFVMTSRFEGLASTPIEAQTFGCVPVVMNSVASVWDIIDDGQNGYIVPNNNIKAFAEKVCLLMDNAELREKMGINGMESAKKFSVENIVKKWEKLFEEL